MTEKSKAKSRPPTAARGFTNERSTVRVSELPVPANNTSIGVSASPMDYQPTTAEIKALRALGHRIEQSALAPKLTLTKGGGKAPLRIDHSDFGVGLAVLLNALGTAHATFADGVIDQLNRASSRAADDNVFGINFALAAIAGMVPKDHIEALLCVQMVSVHNATMTVARRLLRAETLIQQDSAERALNRLARTCVGQVETLKNYRIGGAQRITVEHVEVNQGGQAIVGNFAGKGVGNAQDPEATS